VPARVNRAAIRASAVRRGHARVDPATILHARTVDLPAAVEARVHAPRQVASARSLAIHSSTEISTRYYAAICRFKFGPTHLKLRTGSSSTCGAYIVRNIILSNATVPMQLYTLSV